MSAPIMAHERVDILPNAVFTFDSVFLINYHLYVWTKMVSSLTANIVAFKTLALQQWGEISRIDGHGQKGK